jgi:hypothetical protein
MISCKGYTPLHLACIDCPAESCEEVVRVLLVCGADADIRCAAGRTALEYASPALRAAILNLSADAIEDMTRELHDKFTFANARRWNVEEGDWVKSFAAPSFLFEEQDRSPSIPRALHIHEHHIMPLIEEGQTRVGAEALRTLGFARGEANSNRDRLERLLKAQDSTWSPPPASAMAGKSRGSTGGSIVRRNPLSK